MSSNLAARRRALVRPASLGVTALAVAALSVGALASPAVASVPMNDNFVDAQVLTGLSASASQFTRDATMEPGEPTVLPNSGGHSVWYSWTPPSDGSAVIATYYSDFDTTLLVATGTAVDALTIVAANDDVPGGNGQSRVSLMVTKNTTYRIQVDGYDGLAYGDARLYIDLEPTPAPPVPTGRPVVTGRAQAGQTLSSTDGTWESYGNAPTSYSYEWLRCSGAGATPSWGRSRTPTSRPPRMSVPGCGRG